MSAFPQVSAGWWLTGITGVGHSLEERRIVFCWGGKLNKSPCWEGAVDLFLYGPFLILSSNWTVNCLSISLVRSLHSPCVLNVSDQISTCHHGPLPQRLGWVTLLCRKDFSTAWKLLVLDLLTSFSPCESPPHDCNGSFTACSFQACWHNDLKKSFRILQLMSHF